MALTKFSLSLVKLNHKFIPVLGLHDNINNVHFSLDVLMD